jgi:hypothetical protein
MLHCNTRVGEAVGIGKSVDAGIIQELKHLCVDVPNEAHGETKQPRSSSACNSSSIMKPKVRIHCHGLSQVTKNGFTIMLKPSKNL